MSRRSTVSSIPVGIQALRANPLRSVLSTLGVIIGTAALVAVLALGDGVEAYTRDQIQRTTDLQTVAVTPRIARQVDGIMVPQTDYPVFGLADAAALAADVGALARVSPVMQGATVVRRPGADTTRAARLVATTAEAAERMRLEFAAGRFLSPAEGAADSAVVVLSWGLAAFLAAPEPAPSLVGRTVELQGHPFRVIGVTQAADRPGAEDDGTAVIPFAAAGRALAGAERARVSMLMVRARRVEDVDAVKQRVTGWMDRRYGNWKDRASVEVSAAVRLEQAATGMLIFKLMMGSFAGITLVVGGIGIMNVLLAAVTERTREIGIRRAIGARQRDIMTQFLSESVTISGVGSALGVVLGLGAAFALTALIRLKTDAPVHAAVTAQSLGVVALVAVAVGLLFGTYPALRAARLPPIEAIRHE